MNDATLRTAGKAIAGKHAVKSSKHSWEAQLFFGLYEQETYASIRQASAKAKWFIDVGAGKGELCIFFATLKHVKEIIAIELDHFGLIY
jgi:hypothetical protein